ncbi:hypothetical protein F5Y19DRAFT_450571 [Xylariaceae sp. FL1651]|nr:hypothetical protein F5Y19DRAFT_450571 [Xylariaceae sp. FL1651]
MLPPGSITRGGDGANVDQDTELNILASHNGASPLNGRSSPTPFSSLRGSLREPVDAEVDIDDDPQTHQNSPTQGTQANYSEVPHLDPEEAEVPAVVSHRGAAAQYHFQRYIPRAVLNVLGPLFILSFYIFIVVQYFERPAVNGIAPARPLDANTVFFAWLILSIFVLDWAKSGIAGFEAAALMTPCLAPSDARQLMWHADRAWGSVSGWCKVLVVSIEYVGKKLTRKRGTVEWQGPSLLWFYLAISSLLFYITVPLSGLSMDPDNAFQLSKRPVTITGTNQSTFDARASNDLAEQMDGRWRQGNPTSPYGATVFYAPEGTSHASDTYFEDTIQGIYHDQLTNDSISAADQTITFFAGPEVTERAYGTAWGFLTDLSCTPVHPYTGLELLQVKAINNWTAKPAFTNSRTYGTNISTMQTAQLTGGTEAVFFDHFDVYATTYQYVMAANADPMGGTAYGGATNLPVNGTLELVMWQSYAPSTGFEPDETFLNMSSIPFVVSSVSAFDNQTYLGYGIRCKAVTNTGRAFLSATTNTFSTFQQEAPLMDSHFTSIIAEATGVVGLHTLVYTAFTSMPLAYMGPPKCDRAISVTCSGWVGANLATKGVPLFKFESRSYQYPTLSPARMALALSKLFGEAAVAVMGRGPGNWTSSPNATSDVGIFGLEPVNNIVPGRVPYQLVLILLSLWAFVTILPQLWPTFFYGRRWGEVLDGFAMFRFGAEWKGAVSELESDEFWGSRAAALKKVPGMVGDMNPRDGSGKLNGGVDEPLGSNVGFVGLSHSKAETSKRRIYTYRSV